MKYSVLWHDCEDQRGGQEFSVEGESPSEAYFKASSYIRNLSSYLKSSFVGIDLECLVDENGKHHYPDIFLDKKSNKE